MLALASVYQHVIMYIMYYVYQMLVLKCVRWRKRKKKKSVGDDVFNSAEANDSLRSLLATADKIC